jgi:hypothetical protein
MLKVKYRATRTAPVCAFGIEEHCKDIIALWYNCMLIVSIMLENLIYMQYLSTQFVLWTKLFVCSSSNYRYREEHVSCIYEIIAARYRHMWAAIYFYNAERYQSSHCYPLLYLQLFFHLALFLLAIVWSVLLQFTTSEYTFGIINLSNDNM